jgi:hypothetical protein
METTSTMAPTSVVIFCIASPGNHDWDSNHVQSLDLGPGALVDPMELMFRLSGSLLGLYFHKVTICDLNFSCAFFRSGSFKTEGLINCNSGVLIPVRNPCDGPSSGTLHRQKLEVAS